MGQNVFVFVLLSALLVASCTKETNPDTQYDIETDFYIDIIENLSPTGNSLVFQTETVLDQSCLNIGIDCRFSTSGSNAQLSFINLIEPSECEEGDAPAQATVQTGDLTFINYMFKVSLRNEVESIGTLNVTDDRYIVSFPEQKGFEMQNKVLLRVPRYTFWGYVNYSEEDSQESANELVSSLENISTGDTFEQGYYGHFSIDSVGQINGIDKPPTGTNLLFRIKYNGSENDLMDLINDARASNENLDIFVKNWEGEIF